MNRTRLGRGLALAAIVSTTLTFAAPAAHAGYPVKCDKNTVLVVHYDSMGGTYTYTTHPTIQSGVDAARGNPAGSSVGDTVIVCPGTYRENVSIPGVDDRGTPDDPSDDVEVNTNISVRSWDGPHGVTIIGDLTKAAAVVDIDANGVNFGGAGLGFTILAEKAPATGSLAGIQVGDPMPVDMNDDDDPNVDPLTDCWDAEPGKIECPDKEEPALTPINVSVVGNDIRGLAPTTFAGTVAGIAVNNTNNTLVFRNRVKELSVTGAGLAYGIRFADTNSNVEVLQNAVQRLTQSGGSCGTTSLGSPRVGAVGISAEDEALDALFFNNLVEKVQATCTAVGAFSNAWGGLENDRNGQQIPIVTDIVNNKVKDVIGAQRAGVVLAVVDETARTYGDGYGEDEVSPPASFRVSTNDLDSVGIGVAVFQQLAAYSYIEQNNFDNDDIGVLNTGNVNLDATNNYWGCDEGPRSYSGKNSCADVVTLDPMAVGATTYVAPWLRRHVDHAGAHAGDHAGHH